MKTCPRCKGHGYLVKAKPKPGEHPNRLCDECGGRAQVPG